MKDSTIRTVFWEMVRRDSEWVAVCKYEKLGCVLNSRGVIAVCHYDMARVSDDRWNSGGAH